MGGDLNNEMIVKSPVSIGRFCCISSNVHIGFPEHSTTFVSSHPLFRFDHSSDWIDIFLNKEINGKKI